MLDIRFIREHTELVKEAVRKKHLDFDVDALLRVDEKRLGLIGQVEVKRAEQNKVSDEIGITHDSHTREQRIAEMKKLKDDLALEEDRLKIVTKEWQELMLRVPNLPDVSVPEGETEADSIEIRTGGKKPNFTFAPKSHIELMNNLGLADFERGAKVSGFRGYFLKNDGVRLSLALWQYALDTLTHKGFESMIVPSLVRREAFMGTGYLPQGEEDLYKTQDNTYLTGTGEVGAMGFYMNEVVDRASLPVRFAAFSPCFRREIGAHGKDTKGLIRVHEFYKVEQVVLCEASHEESAREHEALTANAEEMIQALELPYRIVAIAGGDLGLGQVKKYDIECWIPSEERYRETHSSSYFHDFQTRRLNIRYRDVDGKLRFLHSLNNTALATPRIIAAIIEQYQEANGTIRVPRVLVPYMGTDVIGGR